MEWASSVATQACGNNESRGYRSPESPKSYRKGRNQDKVPGGDQWLFPVAQTLRLTRDTAPVQVGFLQRIHGVDDPGTAERDIVGVFVDAGLQ